jgi:hypothetical protein
MAAARVLQQCMTTREIGSFIKIVGKLSAPVESTKAENGKK